MRIKCDESWDTSRLLTHLAFVVDMEFATRQSVPMSMMAWNNHSMPVLRSRRYQRPGQHHQIEKDFMIQNVRWFQTRTRKRIVGGYSSQKIPQKMQACFGFVVHCKFLINHHLIILATQEQVNNVSKRTKSGYGGLCQGVACVALMN